MKSALSEGHDHAFRERPRVNLDRHLRLSRDGEGRAEASHQPKQILGLQDRRRASSEVHVIDGKAAAETRGDERDLLV